MHRPKERPPAVGLLLTRHLNSVSLATYGSRTVQKINNISLPVA